MKKRALFLSIILSLFIVFGCADKAKEKYETAQFEELQTNFTHAKNYTRPSSKTIPTVSMPIKPERDWK